MGSSIMKEGEGALAWFFTLLWAGWSCEIASGASAAGVGIPTLPWYRRKRSELSGMDNNGAA